MSYGMNFRYEDGYSYPNWHSVSCSPSVGRAFPVSRPYTRFPQEVPSRAVVLILTLRTRCQPTTFFASLLGSSVSWLPFAPPQMLRLELAFWTHWWAPLGPLPFGVGSDFGFVLLYNLTKSLKGKSLARLRQLKSASTVGRVKVLLTIRPRAGSGHNWLLPL